MKNLQSIFTGLHDLYDQGFIASMRYTQDGELRFQFPKEEERFTNGVITRDFITSIEHCATIYLFWVNDLPFGSIIEYWDHFG